MAFEERLYIRIRVFSHQPYALHFIAESRKMALKMRKIWFQRLVLFIFTGLGFSPLAQNDILASNVLQASDELLVPSEVLASNVTVSNPLMFSSIDPIVIKPVTVEGQSRKIRPKPAPLLKNSHNNNCKPLPVSKFQMLCAFSLAHWSKTTAVWVG